MLQARELSTDTVVANRLRVADTHWSRLRGLLGTSVLRDGEGLWIKPCRQVHMFGMRYPIDVVFLDAGGRIVRTVGELQPNSVSPKVRDAESVLELPAGTISRAALCVGSAVAIDGAAEKSRDWLGGIAAAVCNLLLAGMYLLFFLIHFNHARRTGEWATTLPIVAQESILIFLFLSRRRAFATSRRALDWVLGVVGTFLPLLLRTGPQAGPLYLPGAVLQTVGFAWVVAATLSLGRSVGVVAGNRGVRTSGLYRLVRHPMYGGYAVSFVGYVAAYPTVRNALILLGTLTALFARAVVEERFLEKDATYRDYLTRTRWRFLPYVL
jgi:protein-S-isoprenylcysteine O-methyltransferase Ste14/uncharacterized membrane protein (UPF0127 family)